MDRMQYGHLGSAVDRIGELVKASGASAVACSASAPTTFLDRAERTRPTFSHTELVMRLFPLVSHSSRPPFRKNLEFQRVFHLHEPL